MHGRDHASMSFDAEMIPDDGDGQIAVGFFELLQAIGHRRSNDRRWVCQHLNSKELIESSDEANFDAYFPNSRVLGSRESVRQRSQEGETQATFLVDPFDQPTKAASTLVSAQAIGDGGEVFLGDDLRVTAGYDGGGQFPGVVAHVRGLHYGNCISYDIRAGKLMCAEKSDA